MPRTATYRVSRRRRVRRALLHAAERARERYGLELTPSDVEELARRIQHRQARRLARETHTRSTYAVHYRGVELKVVYSHSLRTVVTVLSPDMRTVGEARTERAGKRGKCSTSKSN